MVETTKPIKRFELDPPVISFILTGLISIVILITFIRQIDDVILDGFRNSDFQKYLLYKNPINRGFEWTFQYMMNMFGAIIIILILSIPIFIITIITVLIVIGWSTVFALINGMVVVSFLIYFVGALTYQLTIDPESVILTISSYLDGFISSLLLETGELLILSIIMLIILTSFYLMMINQTVFGLSNDLFEGDDYDMIYPISFLAYHIKQKVNKINKSLYEYIIPISSDNLAFIMVIYLVTTRIYHFNKLFMDHHDGNIRIILYLLSKLIALKLSAYIMLKLRRLFVIKYYHDNHSLLLNDYPLVIGLITNITVLIMGISYLVIMRFRYEATFKPLQSSLFILDLNDNNNLLLYRIFNLFCCQIQYSYSLSNPIVLYSFIFSGTVFGIVRNLTDYDLVKVNSILTLLSGILVFSMPVFNVPWGYSNLFIMMQAITFSGLTVLDSLWKCRYHFYNRLLHANKIITKFYYAERDYDRLFIVTISIVGLLIYYLSPIVLIMLMYNKGDIYRFIHPQYPIYTFYLNSIVFSLIYFIIILVIPLIDHNDQSESENTSINERVNISNQVISGNRFGQLKHSFYYNEIKFFDVTKFTFIISSALSIIVIIYSWLNYLYSTDDEYRLKVTRFLIFTISTSWLSHTVILISYLLYSVIETLFSTILLKLNKPNVVNLLFIIIIVIIGYIMLLLERISEQHNNKLPVNNGWFFQRYQEKVVVFEPFSDDNINTYFINLIEYYFSLINTSLTSFYSSMPNDNNLTFLQLIIVVSIVISIGMFLYLYLITGIISMIDRVMVKLFGNRIYEITILVSLLMMICIPIFKLSIVDIIILGLYSLMALHSRLKSAMKEHFRLEYYNITSYPDRIEIFVKSKDNIGMFYLDEWITDRSSSVNIQLRLMDIDYTKYDISSVLINSYSNNKYPVSIDNGYLITLIKPHNQ